MRFVPSWLALVALCALLWLPGCRLSESDPNLLDLVDVSPRDLEVGDRLEVIGTGFPEGKPATLSFEGSLHRPGRTPISRVRIVAFATATSQNRISLMLTEALQRELCGVGDEADHTTFRGRVVAAFSPKSAGAPPITGTLENVVLDVATPTVPAEVVRQRDDEGARLLALAGLVVARGAAGLEVGRVAARSRAERAGLVAGDVLLEVDGVTAQRVSDLAPSGAGRLAEVVVRRGRLKEPVTRSLDVQGFRPTAPKELAPAAALTLAAAALLLLLLTPPARLLTWGERRVVQRLRALAEQRGRGRTGLLGVLRAALAELRQGARAPRFVQALALLAATSLPCALALGMPLVHADLDLGLLLAVSTTTALSVALILAGARPGRWSLVAGLRGAVHALGLELPALIAVASAVLLCGSLRLVDAVTEQGGAPWQWNALRAPALLVALSVVVLSVVPEARAAGAALPEADAETPAPPRAAGAPARILRFLFDWGRPFLLATVVAALLLGGWRLPGLGPSEQLATPSLRALGVLTYEAKIGALLLLVRGLRWALPRLRVEQVATLSLRWLLPLSLLSVFGALGWLAGLQSPALRSTFELLGHVLFGAVVLLTLYFLRRVAAALAAPSPQPGINQWL